MHYFPKRFTTPLAGLQVYAHEHKACTDAYGRSRPTCVIRSKCIDWKAVRRRVRELRGQSEAGAEVLLRISEACKKSLNWILTGKEA